MTSPKTVLTVDDSATMRDMLLAALSALGYRVLQAADGIDGLAALRDEEADVIVTDINMPRLDGIGFIKHVRQDARYCGTPILVLTTESDPDCKARARQAGATGWIEKPFDPVKLADAIRRVT
jgi:two-component system, chemotaxis family, chemotaxis protein CheY